MWLKEIGKNRIFFWWAWSWIFLWACGKFSKFCFIGSSNMLFSSSPRKHFAFLRAFLKPKPASEIHNINFKENLQFWGFLKTVKYIGVLRSFQNHSNPKQVTKNHNFKLKSFGLRSTYALQSSKFCLRWVEQKKSHPPPFSKLLLPLCGFVTQSSLTCGLI